MLSVIPPNVNLYVDQTLVPVLSALVPFSKLKEHGIDQIILLDTPPTPGKSAFLVPNDPIALAKVSKTVKEIGGSQHTLVLYPLEEKSTIKLLANFGVLADLDIVEFRPVLVPDVGNPLILQLFGGNEYLLALNLHHLQFKTGLFGKITGVGPSGHKIMHMLENMQSKRIVELQNFDLDLKGKFDYFFASNFSGEEIEHVVLIDRDLDLITPQLLQTTYSGVLKETLGISASGVVGSGSNRASLRNDEFYLKLASMPFGDACDLVHLTAKQVVEEFTVDKQTVSKTESVNEIRNLVVKLGSLEQTKRQVQQQTDIATLAMDALQSMRFTDFYDFEQMLLNNQVSNTQAIAMLQDFIFQQRPLNDILRLLTLLTLLRDGIKDTLLTSLSSDILKTYGYDKIKLLEQMHKQGKLYHQRSSSFLSPSNFYQPQQQPDDFLSQKYPFSTINRAYKLYPVDGKEGMPFSGFVPLTARIAQLALGIQNLGKSILESEFKTYTPKLSDAEAWRESKLRRTLMHNTAGHEKPVVLVVVNGPVSYAEAEAIKLAIGEGKRRREVKIVSMPV